ncbi:adenylate/guanylate cyclase domain-containing protein [Rhizobium metallidurans]|uniref:TolB-like protein/class 3 adenylate cyclase/Tfp pilus assembly protein PilF n=1 Tax=Rhizobium metallidurans TaxID=1265931 RepID=A0A7W6GD56_9HYPH|nr:adenylate/guanylate cyclase domain-containing protein [Rhizobium metallidurans]MBB3966519.1 TolB-like protein/class 3 adenylate cyclase/Tfp pilus assembly protein PilF [Rhizobium metallidurans]
MTRRLAAILDADVVGFSRLMGHDEAGTFAALKHHNTEIVVPAINRYRGHVVKFVGDGTLAEFSSVIDALRCAMEIQEAILALNREVKPDRRMIWRIGIHVGDVLTEDGDIFGESVNIAARLQALAPAGGICLSQQVRDQIGAALDFEATDFGNRKLKNIEHPVRVWRWFPPGRETDGPDDEGQDQAMPTRPPQRRRPSIAVLPFANMSNIEGQEHFSDGFTDELIATLARCRWLLVAARNSSFSFKGRAVDARRVAENLGVKYVLEGSVRRSDTRIRITAQLLDGNEGTLLWAERYDRMLADIFDLQDEIASEITGTIEPELSVIEFAALRGRSIVDMTAWEIYLKGLWHLYRFTVDDLNTAKHLFEQAISIDPSFAQAQARLAYVHIQLGWYGSLEERSGRICEAIELAERAITLDEKEPAAHLALGRALALDGATQAGIAHLRHAAKLDHSFAQAHFALGQALCYADRPEEGMVEIREAFRLSPRDPHLWTFHSMMAFANYQMDRLDEAADAARASMRSPNVTFWPAMALAAILGRQGKIREARQAIADLYGFRPGMTLEDARREFYFGLKPAMSETFIERFVGDLAKAGLLPE